MTSSYIPISPSFDQNQPIFLRFLQIWENKKTNNNTFSEFMYQILHFKGSLIYQEADFATYVFQNIPWRTFVVQTFLKV